MPTRILTTEERQAIAADLKEAAFAVLADYAADPPAEPYGASSPSLESLRLDIMAQAMLLAALPPTDRTGITDAAIQISRCASELYLVHGARTGETI